MNGHRRNRDPLPIVRRLHYTLLLHQPSMKQCGRLLRLRDLRRRWLKQDLLRNIHFLLLDGRRIGNRANGLLRLNLNLLSKCLRISRPFIVTRHKRM